VDVEEGELDENNADKAIMEEGEDEPEVYHTSNAENRFDTAAITPNAGS
jgi:hypothetical protein